MEMEELEKKLDDLEINDVRQEIECIDRQIDELIAERRMLNFKIERHYKQIADWAYMYVGEATKKFEDDFITIHYNAAMCKFLKNTAGGWHSLEFHYEPVEGILSICSGKRVLATYISIENFKAEIQAFVKAVERGEDNYTLKYHDADFGKEE